MTRRPWIAGAFWMMSLAAAGCSQSASSARSLTEAQKAEIEDSIRKLVIDTYDLQTPGVVDRMMRLYPDSGPVYSTASGHVSRTREELKEQIETFWRYVGSNMRDPKWEWTSMYVDVFSPDVAALTASYRIPHLTPQDRPHVIAGAWTAVLEKRGARWFVVQEHLSDVPVIARSDSAQADSAQGEDHSGH
jgi:ketosteroid isomerase-like protein